MQFCHDRQYRHTPIKSGQFIEEVYRMFRQMPALRVDLDSVQVHLRKYLFRTVCAVSCKIGLSGSSSLISSENQVHASVSGR